MSKLKALLEQRNEKLSEMEGLIDSAKGETRAMSADEQDKFNALEAEISRIDNTIAAEERARKLSIDAGKKREQSQQASQGEDEPEVRAFENFIRGHVEERAENNLAREDNGAVIPSTIANKIIKRVYDICPIYQLSTRYNVKGILNIPYYDESTQKIEMTYATEFEDLTSTSGKFGSIELKGFLAGVLTKVSRSLINNSQFDIVPFIITAMAESISRWIESELIKGTDEKITGLRDVKKAVTAKSLNKIIPDDIIDVQEAIPDAFQSNAVWIMNKKTRTDIRKFKNSEGDYILNRDFNSKWGYSLLGKDVYTTDSMPEIAPGETVIYYGDMTGLAVKLTESVSIEVLRERFATQHAIGVVGWIEVDSKVENAQKIAKLVMPAE